MNDLDMLLSCSGTTMSAQKAPFARIGFFKPNLPLLRTIAAHWRAWHLVGYDVSSGFFEPVEISADIRAAGKFVLDKVQC